MQGCFCYCCRGTGVKGITNSISAAGVIGRNQTGEAIVGFTSGVVSVTQVLVVGRSDGGGYGIEALNINGIGVFEQQVSVLGHRRYSASLENNKFGNSN